MTSSADELHALEATRSHSPSEGSGADETVSPSAAVGDAPLAFGPPVEPGEVGSLGPYRILKELGRGGMGAVFAALDTRLERRIALKVMLPRYAADPAAAERFLREARAAAQVAHDNVVTVYEADERDGIPYIAMQFLQGLSLDEHLRTKGDPSLPETLRLVREAAAGLAAAHRQGLVHRDVKPGNLWLEAPNGRVKVVDFGLAKPLDSEVEVTGSGVAVGTPAYMSPEQASGIRVDHRTDLFSLGVLLYRLATGRLPFRGPNTMAVLMALATEEPPPVQDLNPNVPQELAELIHQLLARKPDDRPASAEAVIERLFLIAENLAQPSAASTAARKRASAPPQEAAPSPPPRRPLWQIVVACGLALPLVLWGITFFFQTPDGVVRFDIADPEVKVTIDKDGPTITGADPGPIKLKPGKHGLTIVRGDFSFDANTFELKKADKTILKVEWLPGEVRVLRDGELHDVRRHPAGSATSAAPSIADPDRRAAEWVLSVGGIVQVNDVKKDIRERANLPGVPFALSSVYLGKRNFSVEEFAVVGECLNLTILRLSETNVGDQHLARLSRCTRLQSVMLSRNKVTDAGVGGLRRFRSLQDIALLSNLLTDASMAFMPDFASLVALTLVSEKVTNAGLAPLSRLDRLTYLSLSDTSVTDAGLVHVVGCKRLESLVLRGAFSDAALDSAKAIRTLKSLEIRSPRVSPGAEAAFRAARPGCRLTIDRNGASPPPPAAAKADADRTAAEWVLNNGGRVLIEGAADWTTSASQLPSSRFKVLAVLLQGEELAVEGFALLGECRNLSTLRIVASPISDEHLARLRRCEEIETIDLWRTNVSAAGVAGLQRFKKLKSVTIHGQGMDAVIDSLQGIKGLTWLAVSGKSMTDKGMESMERIEGLVYLSVVETSVTDQGLGRVVRCKRLTGLTLSGPFTDAGLAELHRLKGLNRLDVRATKVTASGIAQFRKAVPSCHVEHDAGEVDSKATTAPSNSDRKPPK